MSYTNDLGSFFSNNDLGTKKVISKLFKGKNRQNA